MARPRGKRSRRKILVAVLTIAVSVILIVVGAPRVANPAQHGATIQSPLSRVVLAGTSANPAHFALILPGISSDAAYTVAVNSNESASFCVLSDVLYSQWTSGSANPPGSTFPWNQCLVQRLGISSATLAFTPSYSGTWDIVVLNTNPSPIKVNFLPS